MSRGAFSNSEPTDLHFEPRSVPRVNHSFGDARGDDWSNGPEDLVEPVVMLAHHFIVPAVERVPAGEGHVALLVRWCAKHLEQRHLRGFIGEDRVTLAVEHQHRCRHARGKIDRVDFWRQLRFQRDAAQNHDACLHAWLQRKQRRHPNGTETSALKTDFLLLDVTTRAQQFHSLPQFAHPQRHAFPDLVVLSLEAAIAFERAFPDRDDYRATAAQQKVDGLEAGILGVGHEGTFGKTARATHVDDGPVWRLRTLG